MHTLLKLILLVFLFVSCNQSKEPAKKQNPPKQITYKYNEPKNITICGKLYGFEPKYRTLIFDVNQIVFGLKRYEVNLNYSDTFSVTFKSYTPVDVFFRGPVKTRLIATYPGDTIKIKCYKKPEMSENQQQLYFYGDRATLNNEIFPFQKAFAEKYNREKLREWDEKTALKFPLYLDFLNQARADFDTFYTKYLNENPMGPEAKLWAKNKLNKYYVIRVGHYPILYPIKHNINQRDFQLPLSYYEKLLEVLPINDSMYISSNALNKFINSIHMLYASRKIRQDYINTPFVDTSGRWTKVSIEQNRESRIRGFKSCTKDSLLNQMIMAEEFKMYLDKSEIEPFEKYKTLIDSFITEPYLIEPLYEQYYEVKSRIENPKLLSEVVVNDNQHSSTKELMNEILQKNKNKVIYIDCWATWCGPCKAEMPNSKELMKELESKDVAFVYLCLDSRETTWKAVLAELQIPGQHYLLDDAQSKELRKSLGIGGVPFYILVNQKGEILEKGSHLRPLAAKEKIEKLL